MTTRAELLASLSDAIADYRAGEVEPRTPQLVDAWLGQFAEAIRGPLLEALADVFSRTYISRAMFVEFLKGVATSDRIAAGVDPAEYWKKANLLDIQQAGGSQRDILALFDQVLRQTHGFGLAETGSKSGDFIYLDDCIGTGSRLRADVCSWLATAEPKEIRLQVITPVLFSGSWWIDARIEAAASANGKSISLNKWRIEQFHMENRNSYRNNCDVLWPAIIPDDPDVGAYVKYLEGEGHPPVLRGPGNPGARGIFENDEQKRLLEEAFLIRGCEIRREQPNLPDPLRPLGYHNLDTFGFGSMFVTYRNCPNNTPLALWVEQKEYPAVFPRKTNTESAGESLLEAFLK